MRVPRPQPREFAPFHRNYVALAPTAANPIRVLTAQRDWVLSLLRVPEARGTFRYAPGKWTIKDLAAHMCDSERVFAYRLMRIARGDATPLPGFEENDYARAAGATRRRLAAIAAEWEAVRNATIALVEGLPSRAWTRRGMVNGFPLTSRALFYILVGHAEHHGRVLVERYGLTPRG